MTLVVSHSIHICRTVQLLFFGPTFEEVNSIHFSGPHVHVRIHSVTGNSTPASLQDDWIAEARSVISVLVQPVPAVPHEIGVKADDHLPVGRLLLSDPVKCCVETTLTAT